MSVNTDIFVYVEPDTDVTYDVAVVDKQVEVAIGPVRGRDSVVRLIADDADMCARIADTFLRARDRFVREVIEGEPSSQDHGSRLADK